MNDVLQVSQRIYAILLLVREHYTAKWGTDICCHKIIIVSIVIEWCGCEWAKNEVPTLTRVVWHQMEMLVGIVHCACGRPSFLTHTSSRFIKCSVFPIVLGRNCGHNIVLCFSLSCSLFTLDTGQSARLNSSSKLFLCSNPQHVTGELFQVL